jgi:hypothetical protein
MTEPQINSVGPPPDLHARRVINEMMQHLSEQAARLRDVLQGAIATSADGSPRAQARLQERLRNAGSVLGRRVVATSLRSGKRGKFELLLHFWSGWDRAHDREILIGDKVPPKPWIVLWHTEVVGSGNYYVTWHRAPIVFVSCHVLVRMAQRGGLRTIDDMLTALARIALSSAELFKSKGCEQALCPPPSGWHVPLVNDVKLVLRRHHEKMCLVATTVLD